MKYQNLFLWGDKLDCKIEGKIVKGREEPIRFFISKPLSWNNAVNNSKFLYIFTEILKINKYFYNGIDNIGDR